MFPFQGAPNRGGQNFIPKGFGAPGGPGSSPGNSTCGPGGCAGGTCPVGSGSGLPDITNPQPCPVFRAIGLNQPEPPTTCVAFPPLA